MKPIDDVWKDIGSLPSATTHQFQDFFAPAPAPPSTTTTTSNFGDEDPNKRQKTINNITSPPEYTEKFRRLMKNRESAARSRARKQARADELEHEVARLAKEIATLKRLQNEVCLASAQVPKKPRLKRTRSAPF